MTRVAHGLGRLEDLEERIRHMAAHGDPVVTTRYMPKRHEEMAGTGSIFWIVKHQLVARSPILGFGEAEGGRAAIRLGRDLVRVQPLPRRAHQGWRYLEAADAPPDIGGTGVDGITDIPSGMLGELVALGLV